MNYLHYYTYSQKEKIVQKKKVTTTKNQLSFGNIYL